MLHELDGTKQPSLSTNSTLSLGLPIIVLTSTVFMPIGSSYLKGKGDQSHKYKQLLMIAAIIGIGGVYFAITFAKDFLTFTLIFSASFGCCNGLAYTIPLKICWDYFPQKKGIVSGVIICGFGIGSFIFSFVSTLLANPNNLSAKHEVDGIIFYGPEVSSKVPGMIQKLLVSWSILCTISICCLKPI